MSAHHLRQIFTLYLLYDNTYPLTWKLLVIRGKTKSARVLPSRLSQARTLFSLPTAPDPGQAGSCSPPLLSCLLTSAPHRLPSLVTEIPSRYRSVQDLGMSLSQSYTFSDESLSTQCCVVLLSLARFSLSPNHASLWCRAFSRARNH